MVGQHFHCQRCGGGRGSLIGSLLTSRSVCRVTRVNGSAMWQRAKHCKRPARVACFVHLFEECSSRRTTFATSNANSSRAATHHSPTPAQCSATC